MPNDPTFTFVCEHGAAKSIIAAVYFNKLARENGLPFTAIARGTHPDAAIASKAVDGLREDGLIPTESIPLKLTHNEVEASQRIISFCELPEEYCPGCIVEYWYDVPAVSENYERARDAILKHLEELLKII